MSQPPSTPDLAELIGYYEQLSVEMTARSTQLQEALAATGSTITRPGFSLTVVGVQIVDLTFTEEATSASPVQLREALLTAYAECLARGNNASANAISQFTGDDALAAAVRATVPEDVRDRTSDLDLEQYASISAGRTPAQRQQAVEDFLADPALDEEIVSADRDVTMSDVPEWEQFRQHSDPSMWQYELEQQTRAISERAGELRAAMEQLEQQEESPRLVVKVNAAGRLLDLRLRDAARTATAEELSTDFTQLYAQATATATQAALAVLNPDDATNGTATDDPTSAYLTQIEATFRARLTDPDQP